MSEENAAVPSGTQSKANAGANDPRFADTIVPPASETPLTSGHTSLYLGPPQTRSQQTGHSVAHVGRYDILGEIARGGMGIVYRASDRKLNRLVALKVTQAGQLASGKEAKRFQAEAEAAAKLDHPNIVPIHEVGEVDGLQFISMALIDGPSLSERVAAGPLPPRDAVAIIQSVAEAVAYAHAQGVVHRDLKPSNILVDASGQPRVTDFGLAKRIDADSSLTQAGQIMGTPSYMSPEQAEGKNEDVGPLADVYSLGATLYCLITGRPPFQSANVVDTLKQVVEREPVAPHFLNPAVGRDLDTICLKCLEKRPEKRYASATALAEDLQRFIEKRPIHARPVGDVEKFTRWCRRNPVVAASLTGIAAIFVMAFALVSWSYVRAKDARNDEARQRQEAQDREKAERWERYRANMIAAGSAMQLHNVSAARNALEAAPEEHRNWEWKYFHHQLDTAQHVLHVGEGTRAIRLSPDATMAAAQSATGPAQIWDVRTGRVIGTLPNQSPVFWFEFSPDGRLVAFNVENSGRITIWDIAAGRERSVVNSAGKPVSRFRFSPDGTRLTADNAGPTVRVWDTAGGKQLWEVSAHKVAVRSAEFSPDGRRIVTTGVYDRTVRIWEAETGQSLGTLSNPDADIGRAIFNAQNNRVLSFESYPTNVLLLWDAGNGKLLDVMRGHTNAAGELAFSPDGTRIASGGLDQTIRLWEGRTGRPLSSREGHRGHIRLVTFSPNNALLLSVSDDHTARLWDAKSGARLSVLHGHSGKIPEAMFTPDGQTIATASIDGTVRLWDAHIAERNGALRGHDSFVYDVAFHPDGERVVSASWDGGFRIWNATSGAMLAQSDYLAKLADDAKMVTSVAIHPSGNLFATYGRNDGARLWDMATAEELFHFEGQRGRDARLVFSHRGDLLACGGADSEVRIWDVKRRATVAVLPGLRGLSLVFGPEDSWLAVGTPDRSVRIYDVATHEQTHVLEGHTDQVHTVTVSHDGNWLASGSLDGSIRVWDTNTWKVIADLKQGTIVYGLAFSPDGTRLACACANNMIRFLDTKTFQLVAELDGHTEYVHQIAFSPDGTRLVSGSGDKSVRIWDSLSVQERAERKKAAGGR